MHRFHYFIISACMLFTSCNKDEVITEEVGGQPIIELDSETGIYTVKVDHELTIAPTYQNVEDALFAWTIDGTLVSSGPSLQRTWNECGDFYVKLRVDNAEGYAEEELKVEVKELTPPVISLALPSQGLKVVRNTDYTFTPDIQHSDVEGFKIEWVREGKIVSTENTYTFNEKELGVYTVTINASNIDGTTTKDVSVEVVETMPYVVKFPTPSYQQTSTDRYTFADRPVFLRPLLEYFDNPRFEWSVDGQGRRSGTHVQVHAVRTRRIHRLLYCVGRHTDGKNKQEYRQRENGCHCHRKSRLCGQKGTRRLPGFGKFQALE